VSRTRETQSARTRLALVVAVVGGLAVAGCGNAEKTAFCPLDGGQAPRIATGPFIAPASAEEALAWSGRGRAALEANATDGETAPLVLASSLPPDLDALDDVERRKQAFVGIVLPLAVAANEAIRADRRFVEAAIVCAAADRPLSPSARARLDKLDAAYKAEGDLDSLRRRVDGVPPSLLVAQAAIESGWGTSRFALEGNALFGQRTTAAGRGMQPQGLGEDTRVRVAAFPHLLASVGAYIRNLNTQPAYEAFRQRRAALRAAGKEPRGLDLAGTLVAYSERGPAYVEDLVTIIRGNRFEAYDAAPPAPSLAVAESDA